MVLGILFERKARTNKEIHKVLSAANKHGCRAQAPLKLDMDHHETLEPVQSKEDQVLHHPRQ